MASFTFTAVDLLALVARLLAYAGALGSIGAVFFLRAFEALLTSEEVRFIRRYALVLLVVALTASLLVPYSVVAVLNGRGLGGGFDGELWTMVVTTPVGESVGVRLLGLAVLALGLFLPSLRPVAAIAGGFVVAQSFGLVGHVRDDQHRVALHGLLVIHLLGIGFWIGSLWPLLRLAKAGDQIRIAEIMVRFGELAAIAVGLLIVAGCGLAWVLLEDLGRLVSTGYGRVLLAKLVAVSLLLALAALNKTRLVPALAAGDVAASLRLQRSIRMEIAVVVLLLVVTAVLTSAFAPL